MADHVSKAAAQPKPVEKHSVPGTRELSVGGGASTYDDSKDTQPSAEVTFSVLLDVLCAVMVADGRASNTERKTLYEVMAKVKSPWSDTEINQKIESFLQSVKEQGYRRILETVFEQVALFKQIGKQEVLRRCLNAIVDADEKRSEREVALCKRLMAIVE